MPSTVQKLPVNEPWKYEKTNAMMIGNSAYHPPWANVLLSRSCFEQEGRIERYGNDAHNDHRAHRLLLRVALCHDNSSLFILCIQMFVFLAVCSVTPNSELPTPDFLRPCPVHDHYQRAFQILPELGKRLVPLVAVHVKAFRGFDNREEDLLFTVRIIDDLLFETPGPLGSCGRRCLPPRALT